MWHAGELFFIGYQMDKKPACVWYAGLDKAGALQFDVRVDLPVSSSPPVLHLCIITERRPYTAAHIVPGFGSCPEVN